MLFYDEFSVNMARLAGLYSFWKVSIMIGITFKNFIVLFLSFLRVSYSDWRKSVVAEIKFLASVSHAKNMN